MSVGDCDPVATDRSDASDSPAELFDFVHRYLEDEARGCVLAPLEYERRYPGIASAVALEYTRLRGASPDDGTDAPRKVGPYRLLRLLGSGGQGAVYAAADSRIDRTVALKILHPRYRSRPDDLRRLLREAEIVARLDHPAICPIFEADTDDGVGFLAMPLIPGTTLRSRIEAERSRTHTPLEERTRVERIVRIVEDTARALHAAHQAGILHRDVKPGNIMITPDDRPILLDFGLARGDDGMSDGSQVSTDSVIGTPAYLAPEVIDSGARAAGVVADVYALGVTLYECLTGKVPFVAPTREALLACIGGGDYPRLRAAAPAASRDLEVVVATAMDVDSRRRYRTALDFADELSRVRAGLAVLARPIGPIERVRRWTVRRPALAAALFGILIALGVALGFWQRSERARADYDLVAGATEMTGLRYEADSLWPLDPAQVPALRDWIHRALALTDRLPELELRLSELRSHGTPPRNLERERSAPESSLVPHLTGVGTGWTFPTVTKQFQHDVLSGYVDGLREFAGDEGLIAEVQRRALFLETVSAQSLHRFAHAWQVAIATIADRSRCPGYDGMIIVPRNGLVPIGRNPKTTLYEFIDLFTTDASHRDDPIPQRRDDGRLELGPHHGVVFVLLPGGTTSIGCRSPSDPNRRPGDAVDPESEPLEQPAWRVRLDPFFLSTCEMTQAQWTRATGSNPSFFIHGLPGATADSARLPVEFVSWEEARRWTERLGWSLPTEAQWEYGARGGTLSAWSTGETRATLEGSANVAGAEFRTPSGFSRVLHEAWDDGFERPWPVATGLANRFGLYDVHGNVWEWCRDRLSAYDDSTARDGDGLRVGDRSLGPAYRGGSWLRDGYWARSSARLYNRDDYRRNEVGLRPAASLSR